MVDWSSSEGSISSFSTNSILSESKYFYSFKVENNLIADRRNMLKQKSPDEICEKFFEGQNSWCENKIFKILNYSFETGEKYFSFGGDVSLIEAFRIAYLNHFPIIINPSHFWLMILQGFAKHMEVNNNSERIRKKIVNFEEKENIVIETGINLFIASDEQWKAFINKLLDKTSQKLTKEAKNLINLFNKEFSTSTKESEIANNVTILSSFKKYFNYTLTGTCGISEIIIEGKIEDWKLLLEKVIAIEKFDEEIVFWTNELKKIIRKIIETLITKNPDKKFYRNIVQNIDRSKICEPDLINGWIIKFIPYDNNGKKCDFNSFNFNGLKIEDIPSQITIMPFNLINTNKNGQTKKYQSEIYTGFFGIRQNLETLSIKPVIGYAIIEVKDRKIEEEKKEKKEKEKNQFLLQFQSEGFKKYFGINH